MPNPGVNFLDVTGIMFLLQQQKLFWTLHMSGIHSHFETACFLEDICFQGRTDVSRFAWDMPSCCRSH